MNSSDERRQRRIDQLMKLLDLPDISDKDRQAIEQALHAPEKTDTSVPSLERDLRNTGWICDKAKASDSYSQNIYAALCNTDWQKLDVIDVLSDRVWHCSWRYAGGIVADMRESGDYMDWYCSGSWGNPDNHGHTPKGYVGEGEVTEEILEDFRKLGWRLYSSDQADI